MPIDKLTKELDNFEKIAALFEIPANALQNAQRKFLAYFCSIVLTKVFLREIQYRKAQDNQPLSFQDQLNRKTLSDIKDICETYGARVNKNFLNSDDIDFQVEVKISPDDKDKGSLYFKIHQDNENLIIPIKVHLITSNTKRNQIANNLRSSEQHWAGLWGNREIFVFVDLKKLNNSFDDLREFTYILNEARNTFRHEMQHAMQTYIRDDRGLNSFPGLPSKSIQETNNPSNPPPNQSSDKHSYLDIEFYTDLTDSIQQFKHFISEVNLYIARSDDYLNRKIKQISPIRLDLRNLVHNIAPTIKLILTKAWINEIDPTSARRAIKQLFEHNVIRPILSIPEIRDTMATALISSNEQNQFNLISFSPINEQFFADLKVHPNDGKYRKATIEFYKAIRYLLS